MMHNAINYLSADTASAMTGFSSWTTLIMLAIVAIVFYFFLYRPQKKQEQETSSMRNNLEVGDEVTTIGGIIGAIVSMKGETVTIETSAAQRSVSCAIPSDRSTFRYIRRRTRRHRRPRSRRKPINPKKPTARTAAKRSKKTIS